MSRQFTGKQIQLALKPTYKKICNFTHNKINANEKYMEGYMYMYS